MVNDLSEEKKDPKTGKGIKEYYIVENPPVNVMANITELCEAIRNWPKRCVILGAEGAQWPFTKGKGHNILRNHLQEIGDLLVQQGVPVIHGRQMWSGLE
eukprot:14472184-Alexandrium_andersonii.AAC.1